MGNRGSKGVKWEGKNYKRLVKSKLGRKGYIPVIVGMDEESSQRFMIQTNVFKDEYFCELLFKSAEELGFHNDGVIRILYEPHHLEHYVFNHLKHKTTSIIISNLMRSILSCPLLRNHRFFNEVKGKLIE